MKYLLPLLVLVSAFAVAQEVEVPRYELSTGYSYGNVDYPTATVYGLSPRGFVGSFSTNLRSWAAAEAEVGGQYQNESFSVAGVPYSMNAGFYSFLAGPRVAYRRGRTSPFAHTLFGLARTIAYDKATVNATSGTAFFPYENGLGVLIGGGMDYRVSRHISMRTQVDYFVTQPNGGLGTVTQNNFRVVGGIVFNFGGMTGYSVAKDRSLPPAPPAAQPQAEQPPAESYQLQPRPQSETTSAADDNKSAMPAPSPAASAAASATAEPPASESAPQQPITSWSASQKSKRAEPEPEDSAPAAGITAAPASPETPATATTETTAPEKPAAATAQPVPAPSQPAAMETFPATPRVVTTETSPASAPAAAVVTSSPGTPHVVTTVATPVSRPTVMTSAPSAPAVVNTATPAPAAAPSAVSTAMSAPGTAGVWPTPATPAPAAVKPTEQAAVKPAASAPAPAAVEIAPAQQDTVIAGYDPGSSVSTSQPQETPLGDVARRYRAEKKRRQQLEREHQAAQAPLAR